MDNQSPNDANSTLLVPSIPPGEERKYKDKRNRLGSFAIWLTSTGRTWETPDLPVYRDYMLYERGVAPSTVNTHLSAIRARYQKLLNDGTIRAELEKRWPDFLSSSQHENEIEQTMQRLQQEIKPAISSVEAERLQVEYLRLTMPQIQQLLDQHKPSSLVGVRDIAIISLLVCTGIRENELCALSVADLMHDFDGQPALHVPPGLSCIERLIPYGGLIWGLDRVSQWLEAAGITQGPVFRGFHKGGYRIRETRLAPRTLEYIMTGYPIDIDGQPRPIRPMDLRRTYARWLYTSGMDLAAIRTNLGLKDINSVLDYIGKEQPHQRVPPPFDTFEQD